MIQSNANTTPSISGKTFGTNYDSFSSFHLQSQKGVLFPTDLPHINVDNGISKYSACHNGWGRGGKVRRNKLVIKMIKFWSGVLHFLNKFCWRLLISTVKINKAYVFYFKCKFAFGKSFQFGNSSRILRWYSKVGTLCRMKKGYENKHGFEQTK